MTKKLSVAFIWHMHQPNYKERISGEYLMPWVRFHATKDYLDMLLMLEKFPKIKQTFNIVPSLLDQLYDYGFNEANDIHSRLTEKKIADLSDYDKRFILEHFFDANYENMVFPHAPYRKLFEKRFQQENPNIDNFSDQEYADILAWFNLIWFDPHWIETKPELKKLYEKAKGYTLKDRKLIISIQREIIRDIIPKYKEFFKNGQIEISTSPYYHPILPLLTNMQSAQRAVGDIQLPEHIQDLTEDAKVQTQKAINKFEELFGQKPQGIWTPEQCISPESLELMADFGIKWTITDEGILASTLKKEFIKDFRGDLEDPYDLSRTYKYEKNDKEINILFRNSILGDLIAFEYGNHDPKIAANDLYERIKNIQNKLSITPEKHHIVTIALDGENCWESYKEDGRLFLNHLYELLSEDNSLNITTVSDFINSLKKVETISNIHSGSWINRNFELWVGDPTKNLAWDYLAKTRDDLIRFTENQDYDKEIVERAWEEIYIAESSDWFWWYGEPNDSGQDDLFDKLFRMRLQNVYTILNKTAPDYLQIPLDIFIGKPSKTPAGLLTPKINGIIDSDDEWNSAGCIEIPQGPMYQSDRLVRRIYFGNDFDNIYLRFDVSPISDLAACINEIYIYSFISDGMKHLSPIRLKNRNDSVFPSQKYHYSHELQLSISSDCNTPPFLSEAIEGSLWKIKKAHNITKKHKSIMEVAIPFDDIDVKPGQEVNFILIISKYQALQEIVPKTRILSILRPEE